MAGQIKKKNQTAVERAQASEALSGKSCQKCGNDVKIKDLVNVRQISFADGGARKVVPYHRNCYTY